MYVHACKWQRPLYILLSIYPFKMLNVVVNYYYLYIWVYDIKF